MRASHSSERVSFFGFRERCADGSKPDETPVARAVSSIIRRARAQTHQFPGKTSLHAAMSGWSFRLSLDHPAVGVARGGGEAWLGRGGNAGRARGWWNGRTAPAEMRTRSERRRSVRWLLVLLLLRADGARRKMQASSSFAGLCQNYGNERFQLVWRRSGEVCILCTQTDSKIISSYYFKSID